MTAFARCTTLQLDPGRVEDSIKVVQEHVLPAAQQVPGFLGLIEFADRTTGKGMTFTLWESEQARADSAAWANQIRGEVMEELAANVVSVEDFEILLDTR